MSTRFQRMTQRITILALALASCGASDTPMKLEPAGQTGRWDLLVHRTSYYDPYEMQELRNFYAFRDPYDTEQECEAALKDLHAFHYVLGEKSPELRCEPELEPKQ